MQLNKQGTGNGNGNRNWNGNAHFKLPFKSCAPLYIRQHVLCLDLFTREQRLIIIADFELPIVSHFILAVHRHEHTVDSTFIWKFTGTCTVDFHPIVNIAITENRCLRE